MAVSVRLEPLLEKELDLAVKRLGVTKSQFIIASLEKALGRKDPYELLLKVKAEVREPEADASSHYRVSEPTSIRAKLMAKHQRDQSDWLAFQEAKRKGEAWNAPSDDLGTL